MNQIIQALMLTRHSLSRLRRPGISNLAINSLYKAFFKEIYNM